MSHLVEKHPFPALIHDHHASAKGRSPRGWIAWCGAFLVLWSLCATFARSEGDLPAGEPGVLLLEGNRIVQGRITPQGQTYSVQQPAGTLIVSKEQVRFVGVDLQSVYVHLQDGLANPASADDHVELARWCVGYRLLSEARFEFEAALEIDPSRDDIRRNLTKLDSFLKRPISTESKPVKSLTPAERMAKQAVGGMEVESLGGLPREAGQVFTRRVQPIIMRNCTASACHGPKSDQTFKLNLVYQTGTQQQATTSKNLLALMPYIDRESPKSSKLWKLLKTNHGAIGNSIFVGQKGEEQLESFRNWLLSLEEESDEEPRTAKKHAPAKIQQAAHTADSKQRYQKGVRPPSTGVVQANAEEDAPPIPEARVAWPRKEGETAPRTQPATSPRTEKKTTSAKTSRLPETEPIISDEPPAVPDDVVEDPFDPNEFNSRQRVKKTLGS